MKNIRIVALATLVSALNLAAQNYAARVISYDPGEGAAPGFTNVDAVIGEPSRINPYGEAVDPFNPPYGQDQILSIGAGGSVTVKFDRPIVNRKHKPLGFDFIIFGNSGFIITNEFDLSTFNWIGEPATDGSLFAQNTGTTRVSVSADGRRFYALDPLRAPTVDVLFPTDAAGRFDIPVGPEVAQEAFAGATIEGMRALYGGSAGGAAYDIDWALSDSPSGRVAMIRYVRVEVIEGKAEIDGFSAVCRGWPNESGE